MLGMVISDNHIENVYMCIYVYICVYIYVCMYVYVYVYIYVIWIDNAILTIFELW